MTRRYVDHYLNDLNTIVRTLTADFATLQRRLALWSRDGYPTSSGGTRVRGGVSDPTAAAVLTPDEVRQDRDKLTTLITAAHDLLAEADTIRTRYMTTTKEVQRHNQALTKCANMHGCPDDSWATKAGRCSTCYEYNRVNQRDRHQSAAGSEL